MAGAEYSHVMKATPEEIFSVVVDYERYPDFLGMVKEAEILDHESENVVICRFVADVVKEFEYVLRLEHAPFEWTEWTYVRGAFKDNSGGWRFIPVKDGETRVIYRAAIDFGFLVPKIIARQVVNSSLPSMVKTVEKRVLALRG
ncbi:SRPBCC family protein [bacterium]|nr:SRPBCC family protein [candidate division CSSED10-310 bacterium]